MSTNFIHEVKSFLVSQHCSFEEMESRERTTILQLSDTVSLHLIPLFDANMVLYTSHLFCFSLSNHYRKHGAHIIHLWEDQWIHRQETVKSRLFSLLGKTTRIHARDTALRKIEMPLAEAFLNQNHLNESTEAKHKYGLFKKEQLVSVLTLGEKTPFNNRKYSWEITRYCNLNGTTVVGGLSKLLKAFCDEYHPGHLITYVDCDWSNGKGFESQQFELVEITPPTWYWLSLEDKKRFFPHRIDETVPLSNPQNWIKIYNSGNYKYTWED